jgi:hypothetical protein
MHSRDTTERYPVLADEPLEVRHPRRKIRLIAASFAAAILMTGAVAYAGTSYAIHRAESGLRQQRDQFAAELAERRRERDAEQAAVNRDLCTMVTRLPPDAETDAIRRKYGCGPFVASPAAPEPTPTARTPASWACPCPPTTRAARPRHRPAGTDPAPMSCRVTEPHTSPPCSKPNSGA